MGEMLVGQKWLNAAARFEGLIEAHRILKDGVGDETDELLWRLADEVIREVDDV